MASEIIFHTINITNALSPDEYVEQVARPAIQDMFAKAPFSEFCVSFIFALDRVNRLDGIHFILLLCIVDEK